MLALSGKVAEAHREGDGEDPVGAGERGLRDTRRGMSEGKVETVLRAYAAFERRDVDGILALVSEDFALDISELPLSDFPNTGTGAAHLTRFLETYLAGLSDYTIELGEIRAGGDRVVVACHDRSRLDARFGGGVVERDFGHVWTIRAGEVVRLAPFPTFARALEVAGMAEGTPPS